MAAAQGFVKWRAALESKRTGYLGFRNRRPWEPYLMVDILIAGLPAACEMVRTL